MNKESVLFVGPISPPVTGPGVKNKNLIESLIRNSECDVYVQNTLGWSKKPFRFFMKVFIISLKTHHIWISTSAKGRVVFSVLFYTLSKFRKLNYIIFPAGGSLDTEIFKLPIGIRQLFIKALKHSDMILVESLTLKLKLEKHRFNNIEFFPNPRKDQKQRWVEKDTEVPKIIFLSKIREGKGVLLLLEAINRIKSKSFQLEYYGPIEKKFETLFFKNIKKYDFAEYKGIVEPNNVQKIIASADIFVFPTLFDEGLPGVIVEASFTGVPIVTSNFNACEEYIQHGVNGLVVEQDNVAALSSAIEKLLENKVLRQVMSENFLKLSDQFNIDILTKAVIMKLRKKSWRI